MEHVTDIEQQKPLILIVDDDASIVELLTEVLSDEGFRVTTATNGLEAIEKVEHKKPDLVLLDLMMPVLDGWGFLKRVKSNDTLNVPVVVMTADYTSAARAQREPLAGYLPKPFELSQLLHTVNRVIESAAS